MKLGFFLWVFVCCALEITAYLVG